MDQTVLSPSPACFAFVRRAEGCRVVAYWDVNAWRIGYGHSPAIEGQICTRAQVEEWLKEDLQAEARALEKIIQVPLTQNQLDALVSLAHNVSKTSPLSHVAPKLVAKLNAGDYAGAAHEFLDITKSGGVELAGLKVRRQQEAAMFLGQDQGVKA